MTLQTSSRSVLKETALQEQHGNQEHPRHHHERCTPILCLPNRAATFLSNLIITTSRRLNRLQTVQIYLGISSLFIHNRHDRRDTIQHVFDIRRVVGRCVDFICGDQ